MGGPVIFTRGPDVGLIAGTEAESKSQAWRRTAAVRCSCQDFFCGAVAEGP